jgi:chaperonin GroES
MAKTAIKPLFNNILIKPSEAQTKTTGGIYLPENAKEESQMGTVMAVGEGKINPKGEQEKMVVKVGQKVLYKKWGGSDVKVEGEDWKLVEQNDILAIVG